ncbi:MAG: Cys-tRNA(Pro) deacylase [Bacteroidota bacterium]
MKKTNALRLLDQKKIVYETITYTYDPDNLDLRYIAQENELLISRIYKTLVLQGSHMPALVAVVAGDRLLNLKALAKVSGNKRVYMTAVKELQALTGYIRGGCSPIGMKKPYPVFIDASANELDLMYVNAGIRGMLVGLSPQDLGMVCGAKIADIATLVV